MKIYHTETQEDYYALMVELEDQGILWYSGKEPTSRNIWRDRKEDTAVYLEDNKVITHASLSLAEDVYPDTPIQKYKASKGYKAYEFVGAPGVEALGRAIGKALSSSHDNVNSPKHYTQGELEVIDILQDKLTPQEFEGFLKGNILKYTFREGIKNGTEDMKKGAWYMSKLIDFRNEQED